MAKKSLFSFVALALFLVCSSQAFAQNQGATRGALGGTVVDVSNAVVPGASVTITGPIGSQTQTTTAGGTFLFGNLVPGDYSVKVEKQGFKVFATSGVEVLINNTATVAVTLPTGAVTTTVQVSSTAVTAVDTTSSSVNANLSDTFYNNIPIQRNVSAVILLAPGVVSGLGTSGINTNPLTPGAVQGSPASYANPAINGASGLENLYVADGVVLNDPSFGGLGGYSTIYGPLGVGITPAFVKEEEIKLSGFEPQYGHATGGVVQIVTKSGSTKFHGTIGGYFESPGMQDVFANHDDFNPLNLAGRHLANAPYEGDFELGGYVPFLGLNDHLFFFGAFDPTFFNDHEAPALGSGLYSIYHGQVNRRTNTYAYAGKLTYKINDSTNVESSVFGDPSHTNHVPLSTLNSDNTSGNSKWDYGTRSWDTRLYAAISPTWTADFAFTYGWNHFTETPADTTIYPIENQTQTGSCVKDVFGGSDVTCPDTSLQRGDFQAQGLANPTVNYQSHAETIAFDTSKVFNFAGSHTLSIGYFWQYPTYNDVTKYSTPTYVIPATNATGGDPGTGAAAGRIDDAALQLQIAPQDCTLCPLMNVPGFTDASGNPIPVPVMLKQARGRFDGGISHNTGKYQAAYVNDSWQMSPHVTLNVGLRWEQQRLTGTAARAFFNDQWSPRIGFIVSPNPDSKIYVDFDRLAYILPLDMAVRELSSEDDNLNDYWAPVSTGGVITTPDLNQYGTVQFMPDAAHLLNNATGGIPKPVSIEIQSGGEPFTPGIRMEYNDEFVVGAEHKFHGGFFVSARYIDRRMKRVVEDEVGQSVEQLTALAFNGGSYSYVIGNPSAKQTIFVTPHEITWDGQPSTPIPAGCSDANGNLTPFVSGPMTNTFGVLQGEACFPAVNINPWTCPSSGVSPIDGSPCTPTTVLPQALFGGEYFPHGCPLCKPGLYPNAQRNYQAVVFEVNKSFSNNWQLRSNFRVGRLLGNYEGAFRNDNGQSDPGISSLFDLTSGELGLLGQQLGIGPLNTDRKYVLNVEPSYTIASGFAKNLTLGTAVTVQSGLPLTTLAAQEIYGNQGEVPLFGRGDLGRSPVTGTVDALMEYPFNFGEGKQLKFEFEAFNIADTKRTILSTQEVDLGFLIPNQDFANHVPVAFVAPFSARFAVLFTF
jgi:Carboxypeptidase regulatory-like domain